MKFPLLAILFLFSCINAGAIIQTPDTSHKPWRISKEQFIQKFGHDDTSKALIDYWFYTRETGWLVTIPTSVLTVLTGAGFFYVLSVDESSLIAIATGTLFLPCLILLSLCIVFLTQHSKKKLYKLLQIHQSGKRLPAKLSKELERFMKRKKLSI